MTTRYPLDEGLVEYADAEQYDEENTWAPDDDFYLALAKEIGGPVLDAGCGTGRLIRAMAAEGLDVTGLDITPEMLARAKSLSGDLDVEWIRGDVRTMQLGRKFRLITMTSHGFQHLLTDEDIGLFFDRAREHLLDDGYLAFETRNFAAKTFGGSEEPALWKSVQHSDGRWEDILVGSRYDPEIGVEELHFVTVDRASGAEVHDKSTLRYISVEPLNRLLAEHGFEVVHQYGDWDKGLLGEDQPEVISICRLAGKP